MSAGAQAVLTVALAVMALVQLAGLILALVALAELRRQLAGLRAQLQTVLVQVGQAAEQVTALAEDASATLQAARQAAAVVAALVGVGRALWGGLGWGGRGVQGRNQGVDAPESGWLWPTLARVGWRLLRGWLGRRGRGRPPSGTTATPSAPGPHGTVASIRRVGAAGE